MIDAIGHPADHNCGGVHTCTPEPDTAMLAVPIGGQRVEVCDTVDAASGMLEIDFLVTDTGILGRRRVAADGAGAAAAPGAGARNRSSVRLLGRRAG